MKKYIIILIMIAGLGTACDDFLDVKPTGTLIPVTVQDFDGLLNDVYISRKIWVNLAYMDPDVLMNDAGYNALWKREWQKHYSWDENPYQVDQDDDDWNFRYKYIHIYNQIINNIDDAPLPEGQRVEGDRALIKGEALAQRALEYFLLVNEYAPHYSASTLDAPSVPMPLEVDLTAQLGRSSVKAVYDQIISDLTTAEVLMKDAPVQIIAANFRPGRAAVAALLGTVYLYTGDFEKAEQYSSESLSLYDFVYDFNTIGHKNAGDPWGGMSITDFDYSTDAKSVIWNRYQRWSFNDPAALYHPDLEALYNKSTDRRWFLFSSSVDNNGNDVFPNFCYARYAAENNVGMTVPRVMLVNAEAKARNNDGQGAIDMLNTLATKRYTTGASTFTYTTDADALQQVKDEKRKEFAHSGLNLIDLKRYQAYGETVPSFTRTIPNGSSFTLKPGSDKYVVPIPRSIKLFNPNLD